MFAHPDGSGGQLQASMPAPLEAFVPGDSLPDLAQTMVLPGVESLDSHPPPGSGRLHLLFQILLI